MVKDLHRSGAARIYMLAVGVLLALAASLAPGPVMADEHLPWSPVEGALEAIEEGRFEDIAAYFCEEQQDAVLALDFESALLSDIPADSPVEDLSGAVGWTAELSSATPLDATFPPPPETTLMVTGSVSRTLDTELVFELFEKVLVEGAEASGVQSTIDSISASLDTSRVEFSEELTVLQSETDTIGRYLICSEFVALSTVTGSADEGMDSADDGE